MVPGASSSSRSTLFFSCLSKTTWLWRSRLREGTRLGRQSERCVTVWEKSLQGAMTQLTVTWLDYESWQLVHACQSVKQCAGRDGGRQGFLSVGLTLFLVLKAWNREGSIPNKTDLIYILNPYSDHTIILAFIEAFSSLLWFCGVTLLFGFTLTDCHVVVALWPQRDEELLKLTVWLTDKLSDSPLNTVERRSSFLPSGQKHNYALIKMSPRTSRMLYCPTVRHITTN